MGRKRSIFIQSQQCQHSPGRVLFRASLRWLGRARERHCNSLSKQSRSRYHILIYIPQTMQHKIVGTCQELFKDYLRLTSVSFGSPPPSPYCDRHAQPPSIQEPDPKKIRPYSVLRETVDHLKNRWKQKENYSWICSQFKSVRQDLTVSPLPNFNDHP